MMKDVRVKLNPG